MKVAAVLMFLCVAVAVDSLPHPRITGHSTYTFPFVTRREWNANAARNSGSRLRTPVSFVIIHHSLLPEACYNTADCSRAMRSMQNYHQSTNGWIDIGYNFAVGSDGKVYEGRGWNVVGAHASGYNADSIGIVLIGNWGTTLPPAIQIETTKELIKAAVQRRAINANYKLIGHRQVRNTECPGDALFREISTWDNFVRNV